MRIRALIRSVVVGQLILASVQFASAQPGLPTPTRTLIYRIANPQKGGQATGFVVKDSIWQYLIINEHAIKLNDPGRYADSIFLFNNHVAANGEVVSGPDYITIYLKRDTSLFFPQNPMDLVIVLISLNYSSAQPGDIVHSMDASLLVSFDRMAEKRPDTTTILTAIGYPGKFIPTKDRPDSLPRFPEFRWGFYKHHDSSALWVDIPIVPGSSGSLLVAHENRKYWAIGVVDSTYKFTDKHGPYVLVHAVPIARIPIEFPELFVHLNGANDRTKAPRNKPEDGGE
jgi:hypothetical protein